MQPAALAEAFAGSQRGGTAHAQAARLLQQPVADRLALVAAPLLGDEGQLIALHGRSSRYAICPASSSSRTTQQSHQQRAADVRRDGPGGPAQAALLKQADDLGGKGGESGQAAAEPGDDQ